MSIDWSRDLDRAKNILGHFRKDELEAAAACVGELLGENVTVPALRRAFNRRKEGPLTKWLLGARFRPLTAEELAYGQKVARRIDAEAAVDVDISDLDDRDTEETPLLERILAIPDTHIRSVDETAWAVMLNSARLFRPHRIIILGDFLDMHSTSRHAKDPNRDMQLEVEIEAANAALDQLDSLGATHKHFLEGNHEENLERYLMEKAPALFNVVSISKLLRLEERGWTFTRYRQHLKVGKVFYVHDTGSSGALAHIKSRDAFGGSVVQGHTHHAGASYAGTAKGDAHVGISSGWLGRFEDANYAHDIQKRRAWMHAFTLGWMEPDGVTHLQLVPIINGKACVNGQLVTAA